MKKALNRGILLSIIMLLFLTTSNVFAANSEQNSEINFKNIKRELKKMKQNKSKFNNWNSKYNDWEEKTVNTFGSRFTQDNKVIITGLFNDIENDEVRDYGFYIGNNNDNLTNKISLKEKNKHSGFMEYEIKEFKDGKIYYYQAFIEYKDEIIKGVVFWVHKGKLDKIQVEKFNQNQNKFNNWNNYWNNNLNSNYNNWEEKAVCTFGNRFTQGNKVIISGMFKDFDNDEVRDYGFFIGNDKENLNNRISLKEENRHSGFMDYEIDDLENEKTYYYQAFIEYEDEIIKGRVSWFYKGRQEEFKVEKLNKDLNKNKFDNCNNNLNSNLNNCEEETVKTLGMRFTLDDKAIISGMFKDIDNDEVRDYGFFIGNDKENLTKTISLIEENRHSSFMDYEIDSFEKGKTYYYQSFIEYEDEIIKGRVSWFHKGTQ